MFQYKYISAIVCLVIALLVTSYLKYWTSIDENLLEPELQIPQGRLRGTHMVTRYNRKIIAFKGIPFAQPPIKNLRFKRPVPADAWNGTLDATKDSIPCPQIFHDELFGNEDCLYLNVFIPQLPATEKPRLLPVMFYIFGGRFLFGNNNSTEWGPQYFLDKDVILVVPTYRFGLLGYLSTGDEEAPGNFALKDIVLALEWNRDNIRYFGGDPNQVTLFGSSSGGVNVHVLTLSNSTNGLFHRYITQGASALMPIIKQSKDAYSKQATKLGKHFGCPTETSKDLVACLRSLDVSDLINTMSLFDMWQGYPYLPWVPTVEPDVEGAIITDTVMNLFANGKTRDLPWISVVSRNEGIVYSIRFYESTELLDGLLDNIDFILPHLLDYVNSVEDVPAFTNALKSYYLNDVTADRDLLLTNLTHLMNDAMFSFPAYYGLQQHLKFAKSPSYFCSFNYRGANSYTSVFTDGSTVDYGVSHADELQYLFRGLVTFYDPENPVFIESDWKMADIMIQLWTSFATTGVPTMLDEHSAITWSPFSSDDNYLQIGDGPEVVLQMKRDFLKERMQFWNELTSAASWK